MMPTPKSRSALLCVCVIYCIHTYTYIDVLCRYVHSCCVYVLCTVYMCSSLCTCALLCVCCILLVYVCVMHTVYIHAHALYVCVMY
jgi:hypothetical protein